MMDGPVSLGREVSREQGRDASARAYRRGCSKHRTSLSRQALDSDSWARHSGLVGFLEIGVEDWMADFPGV